MRTLALVAALLAGGCSPALPTASVQQLGPSSFVSTAQVLPNSSNSPLPDAQRIALSAAEQTCAARKKYLLVDTTNSRFSGADATYSTTFSCLNADDPALHSRPTYEKAPTVVVQDRRRQ